MLERGSRGVTSLEQPLVTVPTYQWTPGHSESEFVMPSEYEHRALWQRQYDGLKS